MFFNKLKEELKDYLKERLMIFAAKHTEDIIKGIQISNKSIEELIEKYKHTKWEELTPFEAEILIDRFNLVALTGGLAIYKGPEITFADWHYVSDTLIKVKERQEEKKCTSIPPVTDKDRLQAISAIVEYQKSTDEAIKEIKEILKDVE